jgi:hypothetical protein
MEKKKIVTKLENESPGLLEELLCRRRFTHVTKNTSKALKDVDMNNSYWNLLNHSSNK